MFMCKHCLEQFEDEQLAYTLILENRVSHPSADAFVLKFCSKAHLQEFLELISGQQQNYILTKVSGETKQEFPPAYPLDLLLQVGSTSAASRIS